LENITEARSRKASNTDNPVQAKRSAGIDDTHTFPSTPKRVELHTEFEGESVFSYPALRFACTGLSIFKACRPFALVILS